MVVKATDEEANAWKATAIDEIRRIWIRWGHPALTKFSKKLGINYRTTCKLLAPNPDPNVAIKKETVLKVFSMLLVSVQTEFNTPEDVIAEIRLLEHALANVVRVCYPPNAKLVAEAVSEMENLQGCGLPVK